MWGYTATGALAYSWEGSRKNFKQYAYFSGGNNGGKNLVGKLAFIKSGINSDWDIEVETQRELIEYEYNSFGQVSKKIVDDEHTFEYTYDSLGRVVKEIRPDGGFTTTKYYGNGEIAETTVSGQGTSKIERDGLGRVEWVEDYNGLQVHSWYDPYDRVIKIRDDRIPMNVTDADKTSYFEYDSLGNLIKELGPALRTESTYDLYTDTRRPYTEYEYDNLSRQTKIRKMVNGPNSVLFSNIRLSAP